MARCGLALKLVSRNLTDAEHKPSTIRHCLPDAFSRSKPTKTARCGSVLKPALSRFNDGQFLKANETSGQPITAIATDPSGAVIMTSEQGRVYESRARVVPTAVNSGIADSETTTVSRTVIDTRELLIQPLESSDRDHPGPLPITSISEANGRIFVGTLSRGVLEIANGGAKESQMRPPVFFVNALERDQDGNLWVGARARKEEPGALSGDEVSALKRHEAPTGPVLALKRIEDEMWVGTDGRGVFRISKTKVQRFTFDGTAGGLRSDHVYAIFADREGVIWFGTDRGVCRYDPHAPRVESVGDNGETNFIRSLFQIKQRAQLSPALIADSLSTTKKPRRGILFQLSDATSSTRLRKISRNGCWSLPPVVCTSRQGNRSVWKNKLHAC